MLVEDDPFWIEHLQTELGQEQDLRVVRVVTTREEAVEAVRKLSIDVVLMDVNLTANNFDGIQAVRDISRLGKTKVIMLTSFTEKTIILESLKNGAVNYITKEHYRDIVFAIRNAYANHSPIHASAAGVLLKELRLKELTPTERIVYDLREQGLSKSDIAVRLQRSIETVKSQFKNISKKLYR